MATKKVVAQKPRLNIDVIPTLQIEVKAEDFLTMISEHDSRVKALINGGFNLQIDGVSTFDGSTMLVELSLLEE